MKTSPQLALQISEVLVPVDFSEQSALSLKTSTALAERFGASITLLHVIRPGQAESDLAELGVRRTEALQAAEKRLAMLAQRRGAGAPFRAPEARRGDPSQEIVQTACDLHADLLVIATHGFTGLKHAFLGSTAEQILHHASCPVLVLRRDESRRPIPRRILAPVDFSPASFAALRYAISFGKAVGAELTALHVVEPLGPLARLEANGRAHERKLKEAADFRLAELHLEVDEAEGAFATKLGRGGAVHEILSEAETAPFDLIIVSSRTHNLMRKLGMGSTTDQIVRRATCPVLVFHDSLPPPPIDSGL